MYDKHGSQAGAARAAPPPTRSGATAAAPGSKLQGYFLQVDMLVERSKARAFEEAAARFLKTGKRNGSKASDGSLRPFKRLFRDRPGIELVIALKTPKPFRFVEPSRTALGYVKKFHGRLSGNEEMFRYVNLWLVPNLEAADLVETMEASADDPDYIAIDKVVARETQDFVYQVQWPRLTGRDPFIVPRAKRASTGFVRSIRQYRSSELGKVLFNLATVFPSMQGAGCTPAGTFQAITGTLDTVIQCWRTDGRPGRALDVLEKARKRIPSNLRKLGLDVENTKAITPESEIAEALMLAPYSP